MVIPVNTLLPSLASVYGCIPNVSSNPGIITISPGQIRDSTNSFDIINPGILTINPATVGANGRDAGSFTINSIYYVYVIYDNTKVNAVAGLVSLSGAPTLPTGYTNFRLVGFERSLTSTFATSTTIGNGTHRTLLYDAMDPSTQFITAFGGSTTVQSSVLSEWIPVTSNASPVSLLCMAHMSVATTGGCNAFFSSTSQGSYTGSIYTFGAVAEASTPRENGYFFEIRLLSPSAAPTLFWQINNASLGTLDAFVAGFRYSI